MAVIGAGIVGVAAAIWLQRAGCQVVLIDREGPAAGTSYGNGGVLASCGITPVNMPGLLSKAPGMLFSPDGPLFVNWSYLPRMLPWLVRYLGNANQSQVEHVAANLALLLSDSYEQHLQLAEGTEAEQWLKLSDYVFAYDNKEAFEADGFAWDLRKRHGYVSHQMNREEFAQYDPAFGGTIGHAVRMPDHGLITDPGAYVQALARHFEQQGGELVISEARDIETADGKVTAVITGDQTISCSELVLAAGVWSTPLAGKLGIDVPMESERGYHIELVNPSFMPRSPAMIASGKFVVTPMEGRIRCAGIVEFGGLEAGPKSAPFKLLERHVRRVLPGIEYDRVDTWHGHRPAPSDSLPLIGSSPRFANAYTGFGHHHIGLTGGPKTGRILADMVTGRRSNLDIRGFNPQRFASR